MWEGASMDVTLRNRFSLFPEYLFFLWISQKLRPRVRWLQGYREQNYNCCSNLLEFITGPRRDRRLFFRGRIAMVLKNCGYKWPLPIKIISNWLLITTRNIAFFKKRTISLTVPSANFTESQLADRTLPLKTTNHRLRGAFFKYSATLRSAHITWLDLPSKCFPEPCMARCERAETARRFINFSWLKNEVSRILFVFE